MQVPNFTAYADACAILLPSAVRALPEWRQDALSPHRMSAVSTVGPLTPISRLFHDDARSEVSLSISAVTARCEPSMPVYCAGSSAIYMPVGVDSCLPAVMSLGCCG